MTLADDIAAMYNQHASEWDRDQPVIQSDELVTPAILSIFEQLDITVVLDVGCGTGYLTRKLARLTTAKIMGIDLSEEMIRLAQLHEETHHLGIVYHLGNMTDLSLFAPETFDGIGSSFALHYLTLEETATFFAQLKRVSTNGSSAVIGTVDPYYRWQIQHMFYPKSTSTYENDVGKIFKNHLIRKDGSTTEVWYVHKTREQLEEAMKKSGWNIIVRKLLGKNTQKTEPYNIDPTVVYQLQLQK